MICVLVSLKVFFFNFYFHFFLVPSRSQKKNVAVHVSQLCFVILSCQAKVVSLSRTCSGSFVFGPKLCKLSVSCHSVYSKLGPSSKQTRIHTCCSTILAAQSYTGAAKRSEKLTWVRIVRQKIQKVFQVLTIVHAIGCEKQLYNIPQRSFVSLPEVRIVFRIVA